MHAAEQPEHPNGAVGLSDVLLCVGDADLADVGARYARYLGSGCRVEGPTLVVDLPRGRLTLVPRSALDARLPGETPPAVPSLIGCTIDVRDISHAEGLLRRAGLPVHRTGDGLPFVPAAAGLGAAVIFGPQRR